MALLVFAEINARPGAGADLKPALLDLVAQVRLEAACQLYELYESTEHPDRFIMHERWDDEAGLKAHNDMPHMAAFGAKAGKWLAGPAKLTIVTE
jgi:quinol monooxygenase YgiN